MNQGRCGCREHYIPHRKSDVVNGAAVPREPFRTSFTFRQARGFACDCDYPAMCDSQASTLPPTRKLQLLQAQAAAAPAAATPATAAAAVASSAQQQTPAGCAGAGGAADVSGTCLASDACGACIASSDSGGAQESAEADVLLRRLEQDHVHRVYDAIAPHFSATRCAPRPAASVPSSACIQFGARFQGLLSKSSNACPSDAATDLF